MEAVLKRIETLEKKLDEQKKYTESVIVHNTTLLTQIANAIELKLDLLCTIENKTEIKPVAKKNKPIGKKQYFTNIFKTDIDKYMGELYTSEQIEEIYESSEVTSKKTETQRINKAIDILYSNLSKDEEKDKLLKQYHEDYKKSIESEDIVA